MTKQTWQQRLEAIYATMREVSLQTDPQEMVRAYGRRMEEMFPVDRRIAISRRGLERPWFRVTRYSGWKEEINPWEQKDKLPLLSGGLFAELLYSNRPHIIDDLQVDQDDPAFPYLEGQRSLLAIPMLDGGEALNMVIQTMSRPTGFDKESFPETFWLSNLFGRATHNLVLKKQVQDMYNTVDRELKIVGDIQRSLLPAKMPSISTLKLAASYQTSQRAGGDYYDFFPLCDEKWGILIADVSGHGTPAAVMMAITHSIAHLSPKESGTPAALLGFLNEQLVSRYTNESGTFVTAFYGIYDAVHRSLTYSSAGHNPPRLWQCSQSQLLLLDKAANLPLGLMANVEYENETMQLHPGDRLVLYTDGITEAANSTGELFGVERLDDILGNSCTLNHNGICRNIVEGVEEFTGGLPPSDDRTLVVGLVS